jgi:hypothetical protein
MSRELFLAWYYRSEVGGYMSTNGYDSAFEQATNERGEVRIEIERLLTRGEMLDKLLECLAPFISTPGSFHESVPAALAEEQHSHDHQQHPEHQEHHEYQEHHEHHQG